MPLICELRLSRRDFEYDIYTLIKAFFPEADIRVRYLTEPPEEKDPPAEIRFTVLFGEARAELRLEGALARLAGRETPGADAGREEVREDACPVPDWSDRTEAKNRIKRMLYGMLSAVSGKTLPWGDLTGIRPVKLPMQQLENGRSRAEAQRFLEETYLVSPKKAALAAGIAVREQALLQTLGDPLAGWSLYVGIPFCPSICGRSSGISPGIPSGGVVPSCGAPSV